MSVLKQEISDKEPFFDGLFMMLSKSKTNRKETKSFRIENVKEVPHKQVVHFEQFDEDTSDMIEESHYDEMNDSDNSEPKTFIKSEIEISQPEFNVKNNSSLKRFSLEGRQYFRCELISLISF